MGRLARGRRRQRGDQAIAEIGYAAKDQAETSVLVELISARYERKSLMITPDRSFAE
ncbi:MAG: ATP-binding protein [Rhizobiales bacterium]|nr:ATP-binding protein [Hyphomicrobiales bacterium]